MERLTIRTDNTVQCNCEECKHNSRKIDGMCVADCQGIMSRKLASYEDTGLSPEEVVELKKENKRLLKKLKVRDKALEIVAMEKIHNQEVGIKSYFTTGAYSGAIRKIKHQYIQQVEAELKVEK